MIRHIVLLRWAEGTSSEAVAAITAGLNGLPSVIDTFVSYTHGPDLRLTDGSWDYGIVGDFDDVDGWSTYDTHPEHDRVRVELIRPHVADRATVRFTM